MGIGSGNFRGRTFFKLSLRGNNVRPLLSNTTAVRGHSIDSSTNRAGQLDDCISTGLAIRLENERDRFRSGHRIKAADAVRREQAGTDDGDNGL